MEQQQQGTAVPNAPYPAPPPFWKYFTKANTEHIEKLKQENDGALPEKLPLEFTFLRPPPIPATPLDHYQTFNNSLQPIDPQPVLPPPPENEDQDDILLFPRKGQVNHAAELMKLTQSLMVKFAELMTVLAADPAQQEGPAEEIRQLMLNIHVVINMYRPHQAREQVRGMLLDRLEDGRKEIEELDSKKEQVEAFLEDVRSWREDRQEDDSGIVGGTVRKSDQDKELEEAKRLWRIVHEIASE